MNANGERSQGRSLVPRDAVTIAGFMLVLPGNLMALTFSAKFSFWGLGLLLVGFYAVCYGVRAWPFDARA